MAKSKPALAYAREPESRNKNIPYEQKFSKLIELCDKAKRQGVREMIITWPWIIGDSYAEIIESLSRIADASLVLHVVHRAPDEKSSESDPSMN
jgi:hypothetical protein